MSSFSYKYLQVLSASEKATTSSHPKSLWQSPIWAEILIKTKQAKDIILCTTPNSILFIERRKIFHNYTGLYILGVDSALITTDFLDSLKQEIVQKNDLFLQIEPIGIVNGELGTVNSKKNSPFRRFIEPVTAMLNLENKTEEELQASFAEKGRYNIRLATKRGVTTRWVSASEACSAKYIELRSSPLDMPFGISPVQSAKGDTKKETETCPLDKGGLGGINGKEITYIEAFYNLLQETTERDGFSGNSLSYYRHFVEILQENNTGGLLIAEKDGILHAAGIFAYYEDMAIYYYGASSNDREIRRDMATYLLQWEAIREAMKRGCSEFDFLGISEDGTGKLSGVTEFKLRFNPEKRHLPSEKVIIYRPMILKLLQMISKIRKLFK